MVTKMVGDNISEMKHHILQISQSMIIGRILHSVGEEVEDESDEINEGIDKTYSAGG